MLTIPHHCFTPYLPPGTVWIRGQLERGDGGFLHWQLMVAFATKSSCAVVRRIFGPYHAELSRSTAASEYVWKDATCIVGTRFQLGIQPTARNSTTDWDAIWALAKTGELESIPASVRVQSYRTLRAIGTDYAQAVAVVRRVRVYWGLTGTGKSRLAWEQAGLDAYPKDPLTKFWCGYRDQLNVVIDEFRGGVHISHFLRWTDRHPVIVEVKGGSQVLRATNIWLTSNLNPRDWYPEIDEATRDALFRRLEIVHFDGISGFATLPE